MAIIKVTPEYKQLAMLTKCTVMVNLVLTICTNNMWEFLSNSINILISSGAKLHYYYYCTSNHLVCPVSLPLATSWQKNLAVLLIIRRR